MHVKLLTVAVITNFLFYIYNYYLYNKLHYIRQNSSHHQRNNFLKPETDREVKI